jgi:hypothetical protein
MSETRLRKTKSGWKAETDFPLDDDHACDEGMSRILQLRTYKHDRGGIITYAGAAQVGGGFTRTAIFQDFHKVVAHSPARATEKAVSEQHAAAVANVEAILAEAVAYEAARREKGE